MIGLEVILIIIHLKNIPASWGMGEINFLATIRLQEEGAVIQQAAAATYSHYLQTA